MLVRHGLEREGIWVAEFIKLPVVIDHELSGGKGVLRCFMWKEMKRAK
jgi:hypothetical protein